MPHGIPRWTIALFCLLLGALPLSAQEHTNVILFLVDDMGWRDVGCMGHTVHDTPHIDRLAAGGLLFRAAYSNAPNCAPSRASLLTGQLPPRHGIYTVGGSARGKSKNRRLVPVKNKRNLRTGPTIAQLLRNAGYATASIGKWHLGKDPKEHGFQVNIGGTRKGHPASYLSPYKNDNLKDGPDGEYLTTRLTDEAVSFIEKNSDNPFFLYMSHYGVHTPLQGDPQWLDHYTNKARGKYRHYAAMVKSIDESLGRLVATLEEQDLLENTLVIFFSDNGGHAGATRMSPLRGSKGMLYEGGIRVPLVMWQPGRVRAGVKTDSAVQGTDLLPTILDAIGVQSQDPTRDGVSLWSLATEGTPLPQRPLYWHFPCYLEGYASTPRPWRTTPVGAIRLGRYKLLEFFGERSELYDLDADIGETRNLMEVEPARAKALKERIHRWREAIGAPVPTELNPEYVASPAQQPTSQPSSSASSTTTIQHDVRGHFHFDAASAQHKGTVLPNSNLYAPHVATDPASGELWLTALRFLPGEGERIVVQRRREGAWVEHHRTAVGRYASPTLTFPFSSPSDSPQRSQPYLSYEMETASSEWHLYVERVGKAGEELGDAQQLSRGSTRALHHDVAPLPNGALAFAWQGEYQDTFDIFVHMFAADGIPAVVERMGVPGSDWQPSIVGCADGSVVVAWDGYRESYDVFARWFQDGAWQPTRAIAATAAFEGRVQLARDSRDRVYVAWEVGGAHWGKDYRSLNKIWNNNNDTHGPLHRFRQLVVGVLSPEGLHSLAHPLPQPSLQHAAARPTKRVGVEKVGAFYERCELAVDSNDRPWIFYRHYYDPQLGLDEAIVHHIEVGWKIYARALTQAGWSPLQRFDIAQRDGSQRLSVTRCGESVVSAWGTGRRDRRPDPEPKGVVFGGEVAGVTGSRPLKGSFQTAATATPVATASPPRSSTRARPSATVGQKNYELFFGDLHRHTDLSLCFPFFDGSLDDAYRYAIDAAELDFLAVTDHTRDLEHGDVNGVLWWRNLKEVRRYSLGQRFVPLVGFERSHRDSDHNVISLEEDHLRDFPPPLPEYWAQIDGNTFTIPHAPFIGRVWEMQDDQKRPLLELFQGFRDTKALTEAHKALARGYHLGFIASSDHLSTHSSYACVWAESPQRENIFRSLKARRTYAATDRIVLQVTLGDHFMGERVEVTGESKLQVKVVGTAAISKVVVYRNGRPTAEQGPYDGAEVQLTIPLAPPSTSATPADGADTPETEDFITVVVTQNDGNQAWSSPIWIREPRK